MIGVFGNLALARLLRWRRYNAIHREYVKKYQDGTLNPEEAQRIILVSTRYEVPLLLNYSLAFALFKTVQDLCDCEDHFYSPCAGADAGVASHR